MDEIQGVGTRLEGFVYGGLDEAGNEVEPSEEQLQAYDWAIRGGDLEAMNKMIQAYGHYNVPVLDLPPEQMLKEADHEALLFLDEQEYTVLPDLVRAVLYDDPMFLYNWTPSQEMLVIIRYLGKERLLRALRSRGYASSIPG